MCVMRQRCFFCHFVTGDVLATLCNSLLGVADKVTVKAPAERQLLHKEHFDLRQMDVVLEITKVTYLVSSRHFRKQGSKAATTLFTRCSSFTVPSNTTTLERGRIHRTLWIHKTT